MFLDTCKLFHKTISFNQLFKLINFSNPVLLNEHLFWCFGVLGLPANQSISSCCLLERIEGSYHQIFVIHVDCCYRGKHSRYSNAVVVVYSLSSHYIIAIFLPIQCFLEQGFFPDSNACQKCMLQIDTSDNNNCFFKNTIFVEIIYFLTTSVCQHLNNKLESSKCSYFCSNYTNLQHINVVQFINLCQIAFI